MSKPARSGLSSVKRDWEHRPSSSPEIFYPWDATQKPQRVQQQIRPSSTSAPLTGAQKRMRDIEAAFASLSKAKPPPPDSSQNKRASPIDLTETAPSEKRRRLPPGWEDSLSTPSLSVQSRPSNPSSSAPSQARLGTPTEPKSLPPVFLSQEQNRILKLVQDEQSVFYTGSAGTGKSVLLREIIKSLRKKYQKFPDAVAITASTGIAACNIGGVTVHSFSGIGLGTGSCSELVEKIRRNKKAATRWARTKTLIIDEVSMVDGDLFDKLEAIARQLRKTPEAFGGIQLIVTGDFFQLPPVARSTDVKFAFEADTWKESVRHTFNLTKVFRQTDQTFIDMLNEMRFGNLSSESISKFKSLSRPIAYDDGIVPTELFPRRNDVEQSNSNRMKTLNTEMRTYMATDSGTIVDKAQREKLLSNFMAPPQLVIKVDAQVMLIKNVDESLVNGTMGRVLRFSDPSAYGTEADSDLSGVISASASGPGQKKGPLSSVGMGVKYPVVEFILSHDRTRRVLVMPEVWKVELPSGEVQVSRTQLPLILSWAMSIHKSQGQTLERVKVDLGRVFEKGQAYVALSRATTLKGLQVLNFDPSKVKAHPKVVAWSKTLSVINDSSS